MKIRITWPVDKDGMKDGITIDAGAADVVCSEVFCGVGIDTDIGRFGIAQRDGGIEVMFEGRLLFSSDQINMAIDGCDMSGISFPAGTEKKDWEARFLLVKAKVERLVKGYRPPAAVVGGEKLWGEIKSLQDDINVLLDEKGTDHE